MDNIEIKDGKITAVDWVAVFPSLRLVKCGREAMEWRRMGSAAASVVMAGCGWWAAHERAPVVVWIIALGVVAAAWVAAMQVSRMAAMGAALGRGIAKDEARAFGRSRTVAMLGAPLLLLSPLLVLGGVFWAIHAWTEWHGMQVLLSVFAVALSVVIFPALLLLLPAIAVDGNDAFDAPGRAVSYVLARPWLLALHLLALAFFAAVFVGLPCAVVYGGLWLTLGAPVPEWLGAVLFLPILAYAFSFLITGFTRIYILIRESADGVPETEIWMPEDGKKAPEAA